MVVHGGVSGGSWRSEWWFYGGVSGGSWRSEWWFMEE